MNAPIATVPVGKRWVIRDIVLGNESGLLAGGIFYFVAGTGEGIWLTQLQLEPLTTMHQELRQVLEPTETLVLSTTAAPMSFTVTAYEFDV